MNETKCILTPLPMAAKTFFPVQVKIEKTQKSTLKIMYSKKNIYIKTVKTPGCARGYFF